MSKTNQFLVEYTDAIRSAGIESGDCIPSKHTIKRFVRLFKQIDDSRIKDMTDYPLEEIILIAFLAVLCNARSWLGMQSFGLAKEKWLKKFIKLENGIPSHDTFRRTFSLISPEQFEHLTVSFLLENINGIRNALKIKNPKPHQICIDGKEERGTGRKYGTTEEIRNLQTLHIFDASTEICLYSRIIDKKTNEIPVAQKLLKTMQLKGCIVTADALHAQKETVRIIVEQKGDYCLALKGNQGVLASEAENAFTDKVIEQIRSEGNDVYETLEKAHNKVEKRRFLMTKARHKFNGFVEWQNLRNFIRYEKTMTDIVTGKIVTEIRYYFTSLRDVETCAEAIRGHWAVENKLHWHLDFNFREDDNTTMDKNAFNNYSIINKMVLSLLKLVQPFEKKGTSISIIRQTFMWDTEGQIEKLLSAIDEESIRNALENAQNQKS